MVNKNRHFVTNRPNNFYNLIIVATENLWYGTQYILNDEITCVTVYLLLNVVRYPDECQVRMHPAPIRFR